jgi:chromosome segregation ATPase
MSEEITQNLPNNDLKRILARLDSIDTRLATLEEQVDRRLQETRPIWEQVLKRMEGVESRLEGVESELHDLNRKFRVFNADILKLQDKYDDLEERVRKFESQPT